MTNLTYSVENRLEAVYDGKTLLMAAAYDGDGNRVFQLNYNPDEDNACCNKNFDKHPTACNRNPKTNGQQMPVKDDCKNDGGKDASKDRTGCQSGSQFGQIRCTDGSEDVPERKPDNFHQKEEHSCGILIPEKEEISNTEEALLDKIKGWGNKKNYELTEYVNDVNREYTEVLVEQNISGKMENTYVYGNERLSSDCCNGRSSYYLYDPRGKSAGKEAVAKAQTYLDSLVSKRRQNAFIDGCAKKIEKFTKNSREEIIEQVAEGKAKGSLRMNLQFFASKTTKNLDDVAEKARKVEQLQSILEELQIIFSNRLTVPSSFIW